MRGAAAAPGPAWAWPILGPALRGVGAAATTVGPWFAAVAALALISGVTQAMLGRAAAQDFRLAVVYGLGLSLFAAAPVGAATGRLLRAAVETRGGRFVAGIALSAALLSALLAEALALAAALALGLGPAALVWALCALSGAGALMWTAFAALDALRLRAALLRAFLLGMLAALAATALLLERAPSPPGLVWGFATGMLACAALAALTLLRRHPPAPEDGALAPWLLLDEIARRPWLAAGALCAILGVWADKWVHWAAPGGEVSAAGFAHHPPYDAALFVAHLSAAPGLALLHQLQTGPFERAARRFRAAVDGRAAPDALAAETAALGASVWNGVARLAAAQAGVTALLILLAPPIAAGMGFDFGQFATLRIGLAAVGFHTLALACGAVLALCNRMRLFALTQAGFLLTNALLTAFFLQAGLQDGLSFFVTTVTLAIIAFQYSVSSVQKFDYFYFIGANEALTGAALRNGPAPDRSFPGRRRAAARQAWENAETRRPTQGDDA